MTTDNPRVRVRVRVRVRMGKPKRGISWGQWPRSGDNLGQGPIENEKWILLGHAQFGSQIWDEYWILLGHAQFGSRIWDEYWILLGHA